MQKLPEPAEKATGASAPAARSPRARSITRALYGAYIVIVAAFVISNIAQVVRILYFAPDEPGARAVRGEPCRADLGALVHGIERAAAEASAARDADDAVAVYREKRGALAATWASAETTCHAEPNGPEALAAMTRLDRAAEGAAREKGIRGALLAPVRREVDSFIR